MSAMVIDFPGAPIPLPQPRIYRGVGVTTMSLILRFVQMVSIAISAVCFRSVYPSITMGDNPRIFCVFAVYALCIWSIITAISSLIGLRMSSIMSAMEIDFPRAPIPLPQPRIYRGVGVTTMSLILRFVHMVSIAISAVCFRSVYPSITMGTIPGLISLGFGFNYSGRAGRERPGKCYRLYPESEFEKLDDSTIPEIKRCNLSNVVLQVKALGIDNIVDFDFIKKPKSFTSSEVNPDLHNLVSVVITPPNYKHNLHGISNSGDIEDLQHRLEAFHLQLDE
nr:pre-mRNA-splicing factor ATP-dependent RNA helicase DEAH10-like isoform X1 [Ipomoea batatas]